MGKWAFWACWLCVLSTGAWADAETATTMADAVSSSETPVTQLGPSMDDSLIYDSLGRLLGGLALIVAMIFGAQWLLRKMQTLRPNGGERHLKIVESVAVGQRERVVLLEFQNKHVLVGVASGRVNRLHVEDIVTESTAEADVPPSTEKAASHFAETLAEAREGERRS